ncbi:MAG: GAF domain-containing protein [Saonia sp.]
MRSNYFFAVVFVCISFSCIHGQKFQYVTYRGDEVPFQKVNQVIQDAKEYIWLATDQGLYRFDGSRFEDYNTSLRSRYIKSMIPGENNSILFSNDSGIFTLSYEGDRVRIIPHTIVEEDSDGMGYPEQLYRDSKSRLWVGQLNGSVFVIDKHGTKPSRISLPFKSRTPKIFFGEDQFKTIWALVPKRGLFYFDEKSNAFLGVGSFSDILHFSVENNKLWLVGNKLLQLTINAAHNITQEEDYGVNGREFNFIAKDRSGTYFLSSEEGMYTMEDNGSLQKVFGSNDPHRVEELPYSAINHLYFSPDQLRPGGIIWVSTSDGLGLMSSSYFQSVSGMSHDNVFTLSATPYNEVLLSQTHVYRIKGSGNELGFTEMPGLDRITGISSYQNDTWYGTADAHIVHYRNNEILKEHDLRDRGGGVFYMYADQMGDNWFCQAPTDKPIVGIAKINKNDELIIYDDKKGLNSRILVLEEGGRSELYAAGIGKNNYLYSYDRSTDTFENQSIPFSFKVSSNFEVHDIAVDGQGIVWMGTTDGLLKYDTEHVQRIDIGASTRNEIRSVCIMDNGSLWLATDTNGLVHLDSDGTYVLFDEKSGTPSKVASYRGMILDKDRKLWIGTAEGAVYSSQSNPSPLKTKRPILRGINVNDTEKKGDVAMRFSETETVKLKFVSITFSNDEIKYQHKVYTRDLPDDEVQDIPWSMATTEPEVKIQNFNGDDYELLVRAQKPGGYAWSVPTKIVFKIHKKWYKTWWGLTFLLSLLALCFWYYVRLRVFRKTKKLEASLSQKQQELSAKEEQLLTQNTALAHQQKELKNTGAHIYILHRLLQQIPKQATWDTVLPTLAKLVDLATGIDAFELAFRKKEEIQYRGYAQGDSKRGERKEEFNDKGNLASYAIISNKPVIIGDFEKEIGQYIDEKESRGYPSGIWVPFEQKNGTVAVFCVYGRGKHKFTQKDVALLQILTTFLTTNTVDELK